MRYQLTCVFPTHWSPGEFSKEVAKIPKNTTHLDLHQHHLEYVSSTELRESFPMLPPNVKTLDLSSNYELTTEKLIDIFSVLPPTVTGIILNSMSSKPACLSLKDALPDIPKSVHTLSLSYNNIGYKGAATTVSLIQSIPESITTLILSGNYFVREDNNGLAIVMKALSPTVHTLSLHNNNFGNSIIYIEPGHKGKEMNGTKSLVNGLLAMPHTITSLDLSSTCLFYKNSYELLEIFAAISPNIKTLDLTNNGLGKIWFIRYALKYIPVGIQTLTLARNDLDDYVYQPTVLGSSEIRRNEAETQTEPENPLLVEQQTQTDSDTSQTSNSRTQQGWKFVFRFGELDSSGNFIEDERPRDFKVSN